MRVETYTARTAMELAAEAMRDHEAQANGGTGGPPPSEARPPSRPARCAAREAQRHEAASLSERLFERASRLLQQEAPAADAALRALAARGQRQVAHTHAHASRTFANEIEARTAFAMQAGALLSPTRWSSLSGRENAGFEHFDACGRPSSAYRLSEGDFLRIDVPGPIPVDVWVRVEAIEIRPDRVSVRVRPSYDPTESPVRRDVTAHFFDSQATNTFTVERRGNSIRASVDGRDERPNTGSEAGDAAHAALYRNVAELGWGPRIDVPGLGVVGGPQQHQWNTFTENLVEIGGDR